MAHVECARALMGDDVLPLASDVDQSVRALSRLSRYRRRRVERSGEISQSIINTVHDE
jgi:hypothetical protein